jgi:hypothetical protein
MEALPGENLDLSSEYDDGTRGELQKEGRPFVGIRFACCDVYLRIYLNREKSAYIGHCPRCWKQVRLRVGPGGTNARFFTAT